MALNENLRLPDLLAPIPGDSPVGPDLKYSNEFSEIEWAHSQGQDAVPPTTPPGFPGGEAEEHFGRVIELGEDFLLNKSKDLRVASFLTSAFLRVGRGEDEDPAGAACFKGLSFGLQLLRGLMGDYWEDLHSSIPARVAVLGVLGSDALAIPVRLVPLTEWGHTYFQFKDWSRDAVPEMAPSDENTLWAGNFEAGLADTDKEFYERLAAALEECLESLDGLEVFCKEKFGEAGEPPPRFRDLKTALEQTSSAVAQLLEKKAPPPPKPEQAPEPTAPEAVPEATAPNAATPDAAAPDAPPATSSEGGVSAESQTAEPAAPSPAAAPPPQPPPAPRSAEPQEPDQAIAVIASAARVLRRDDPRSPVPYLLIRGLRWGEIRAGMSGIEPQLLEAPTSDDRRRLRRHFLDEQWEDLLEASEEVMASEAGRGWLDLQRYSILAADKLGKDYHPVAATLRGALRSLLDDLPGLASATLMDDSAAASSETLAWLTAAGFVQEEEEGEIQPDPGDDTDPDQARREGGFDRAKKLVQGGDPDGAIRLLMRRADRERSERARFLTRAEAAAIMVGRGELAVARPILDGLLQEVDGHNLDEWEAGEVVARPLGLLYRCLDPAEGPLRQQIYQRICRLDPLLARSIGEAELG
jgi:type VI secretion system protein ImpA